MTKPEFTLIQGDPRQPALARLLEEAGFRTQLLPAPEKWKYENLPPPGTRLPVANATPALRQAAEEQGFLLMEYGRRPDFKAENGHITAENALCLAMLRGTVLRDAPVLVLGYGAIGSALSQKLQALGARVWVAARKPEVLDTIGRTGCCPVPLDALEHGLPQVTLVFNTIPAMVLTKPRLALLPHTAQVLDLASAPGGTDFASARALGLDAVPALGLPGKMTPDPAAAAIFHTLMQMLREEL
jgi:dipicolinate synthase subunit A